MGEERAHQPRIGLVQMTQIPHINAVHILSPARYESHTDLGITAPITALPPRWHIGLI
jgi:hypothetical protein